MPQYMKLILAMLTVVTASVAPSTVKVIDQTLHGVVSMIPPPADTQGLPPDMSAEEVKSVTNFVVKLLRARGS